jgi:hypothetical protein
MRVTGGRAMLPVLYEARSPSPLPHHRPDRRRMGTPQAVAGEARSPRTIELAMPPDSTGTRLCPYSLRPEGSRAGSAAMIQLMLRKFTGIPAWSELGERQRPTSLVSDKKSVCPHFFPGAVRETC